MNINGAIGLFFIVAVIYLFIITIITTLFRINELPKYLAKFQTTSPLTNSGHATAESELMLTSKKEGRFASEQCFSGIFFPQLLFHLLRTLQ